MAKTESELYCEMGQMLCYLHGVEEVITMVTWIIDCSVDKTARPFEDYDRKTLGPLMRVVSKQVSVDEDFAIVFKRFLDARNRFAHDFTLTCHIDEEADTHRDEISSFLQQLRIDAKKVKGVFLRYMMQAFALWDDDTKEAKIVASLRAKGHQVPDDLLDSLYGPFDDPLNLNFTR